MAKLVIEREEYVNKTFRLNVKLVRELEKICETKNVSLNKLVDICLWYALQNIDQGQEDETQ